MHIRTFRANSLQDALEQIRSQMGPDASVLHTRQVRDGLMGWLGRTYVEVTAGLKDGEGNEITGPVAIDQNLDDRLGGAGQGRLDSRTSDSRTLDSRTLDSQGLGIDSGFSASRFNTVPPTSDVSHRNERNRKVRLKIHCLGHFAAILTN